METSTLTSKTLAKFFDHTLLKAFASEEDFKQLCEEAKQMGCAMVAINSYPVSICKKYLEDSDVHVGAAIGFPLGQSTIATKVFETKDAIANGCDEIDYVINIGKVKEQDFSYIKEEMEAIVSVCAEANVISKVIFENCYLSKEEIIALCAIAKQVKPNFIKTSTGFGVGGATYEDVALMVKEVDGACEIKAAGGIRDWPTCKKMIALGATRIGTSSAANILKQFKEEKGE